MNFFRKILHLIRNNNGLCVCLTHIGKRPNHEDNYCFDRNYLTIEQQTQMSDCRIVCKTSCNKSPVQFYAVSDGMGGHNAGEVASRICVEKLSAIHRAVCKSKTLSEATSLVQAAIADINETICETSRKDEKCKGMGATLVVFVAFHDSYAVLNVGDSRAYHFDGSKITQLTKDNTEGQRMLDMGLISESELADFPSRKMLNRYLGYDQQGLKLRADEYYPNLGKGTVMLCSDGITDAISDDQIATMLCAENDLATAGKNLVEKAIESPYADNSTVILIPIRR